MTASGGPPSDMLLDELLSKAVSTRKQAPRHEKIEGVLIGALRRVNNQGQPEVSFSHLGNEAIVARSLIAITAPDAGRAVALGFEEGNPRQPIILGFMHPVQESAVRVSGTRIHVETEDGSVLLEAEDELELRCGEAVILMQADGRITLRGQYITSHANAGQRIRGGSVQIN
jgi:hypothetical protein